MTIDIIKKEIPEEISAEGGASLQIVNKVTIPLESSIKEAKEAMLVVGDELTVRAQFEGLIRSMALGVARDGHSRQLGDFLTVYAQPYGEIDLDKGWDESVNGFKLKARLLNEMEIDITDWTLRDVTPGRTPFRLYSASTGDQDKTVAVGSAVHLNGADLPAASAAVVEWAVASKAKSGTVLASKLAGDATRYDIAADALAELASAEYDGEEIVFIVRGNKAKASVKATLKYAAPVPPTITKLYSDARTDGKVAVNPKKLVIEGAALATATKDNVVFKCMDDVVSIPATASWTFEADRIIVDNGDVAMATGGTDGDDFSVTITKTGCDPVKFETELG